MSSIPRTATVSRDSEIAEGVVIGQDCRIGRARIGRGTVLSDGVRIGDDVIIGEGNAIGCGTIIKSGTSIGHANRIAEYCILGGEPLVAGPVSPGLLAIGDENVIREFATIQTGTGPDGLTRVGSRNFLMPRVQIGHDSVVGSEITLTNNTALSGHVTIQDRAVLGLSVAVHQHCRIGELAMVGASAYVSQDVLPFVLIDGRTGGVVGLNRVGLRRGEVHRDVLVELKQAYQLIFRSRLPQHEILKRLATSSCQEVRTVREFIEASRRGVQAERRAARTQARDMTTGDDHLHRPATIPLSPRNAA